MKGSIRMQVLAVVAFVAALGAKAEDWYLTKTMAGTGNAGVYFFNATYAPTCLTNAAGDAATGAIPDTDACHIANNYTWYLPWPSGGGNNDVIMKQTLHLGAVDGSSAGTIVCGDNRRLSMTGPMYWHRGEMKSNCNNRKQGLKGSNVYFDCAGQTHKATVGSQNCQFFLSPAFHCDEAGVVFQVSGSQSTSAAGLTGNNEDYRGSMSLSGSGGFRLVAGHANSLGDPTVPRADALTIDGANVVFAVQKNVVLNEARGITINKSGFSIAAATISGGTSSNAYSYDCTAYELSMPISGDYGFTKTGTGTVTLSGDYTAGEIVVSAGKLVITADAAFPARHPITVKADATLEVHQPLAGFAITAEEGATVLQVIDPIVVPFDATAHTATTVLRKRLVIEPGMRQPISLSAAYPVPCHEGYQLEVLRVAPGSQDFTAGDFEDQTTKSYGLPRTTFSVVKDGDGTQHVYLSVRPVVKSTQAIKEGEGINGNATHWSDSAVPHDGADYLLVHYVWAVTDYQFKGDSLTIAGPSRDYWVQFSTDSGKFETKTGTPVVMWPGTGIRQSNTANRDVTVGGLISLGGSYGDSTGFNFALEQGKIHLDATLVGEGTLRMYGDKNDTSLSGLYGDNTNYFGKILFDGNSSTIEGRGVQVRVKDWRSFGGRLDEFHADAITMSAYAEARVVGDIVLTNDMNRGFRIANNGGFNCNAGKTFKTTWPISLNGTLYKHGEGTLILGGALTHETGSTGNFVVRSGTVGILNDAAAEGLTVKATNDFAIAVSPESTAENGFTGLELAPPPGSETLPKVTVKVDAERLVSGNVNKMPICTVANDSGITVDTFVVERVPRYLCSLVAEPVDATTTRYSLKCSKPGLIIVVQ